MAEDPEPPPPRESAPDESLVNAAPPGRTSPGPAPPNGPPTASAPRAKITLGVVVLFVVALNSVIIFKMCTSVPERVVEKAGHWLTNVAAAFNQGRITTEFISYATTVEAGHRLQFATLKQMEIFTRKDEATTAFGYVPLPDIVVEARAPVEYTYYLDLTEPWKLVVRDGVVHVYAPAIRFNLPAVDASAITYEVRQGSLFRDTEAAKDNLKKSITSMTRLRAQENIQLVRETGRRQVGEFIEKWLMRSFSDGKDHPVKVYFPDESAPLELRAPETSE